jgi:NADH:ubiquinone oxidoreductase subunit D
MATDKECVGYARECVRLARLTQDQRIREQLLNMAREWMAVAMHEEKSPQPKSAIG